MNQQQQYRRSKWIHPSLGILNLPIAAIAISVGLLRYAFRIVASINRGMYRIASRVEQWAAK
ncbi:hypothetical protein [Paraburkholderia fungorum]|uniref:hypothetical protein n=1 Tax=Paraburkholderia fungorum TaxID=134537 RepID=UPI000485AB96|nr:hypothetical protein [Paraburkholderia fungorum]